ncbi:hypothetical protein [Massilia varians]|uniref:hypothetical protein n=1 Tax=Massilia varians TaxID=457921 RepID=UPI002493A438|nr:hypothetical protein [Massilia varians]
MKALVPVVRSAPHHQEPFAQRPLPEVGVVASGVQGNHRINTIVNFRWEMRIKLNVEKLYTCFIEHIIGIRKLLKLNNNFYLALMLLILPLHG